VGKARPGGRASCCYRRRRRRRRRRPSCSLLGVVPII